MKRILKNMIFLAITGIILITMIMCKDIVRATGGNYIISESSLNRKAVVSYDESKYQIYWTARVKITSRNQYGSGWSNLDEGDVLGTATINTYYLEPKESEEDGGYYAIAGCQVRMEPEEVDGNVKGMSQMAEFGLATENEDSRLCFPSIGTFDEPNIIFIQKDKNGDFASWSYDYKSKDGDVKCNSYLMSPNEVDGQVKFRINDKSNYIPGEMCYNIRFGAGNVDTGKVANRVGFSTKRDMSINEGIFKLSY